VGLSLSDPDSYEAISAGHAIANNGRTHGQQTSVGFTFDDEPPANSNDQ
jgi:hypothetical protein